MGPFTVLHYTGADADRGGILTVIREMAGAGLGKSVVWVAPGFRQTRAPRLRLLRKAGPPGESIGARSLLSAAGVAWRLGPSLNRHRRIFHGHSRAGLLVGLWLQLFGGERVVVSVHCHGRQRWFYRWAALVLGTRLVWLTPAMKVHYDAGARTWQGCQRNFLAREKVGRVIPHAPVGCEPIPQPQSQTQARRVRDNAPYLVLGGIGSLVPWKGWHLVLEALAKLPEGERKRVTFLQLGSPENTDDSREYWESLLQLAVTLGVSEQVTWRGEASSSASLLSEIDLLVVPSDSEPFSLALLEAWRAGAPVLAADSGGPAELITEGRDGWLFANGSSDALAGKISSLLRDDAWREARPVLPPAEPVIRRWRELYGEVLA